MNKTALITGCARRLGKAMALHLANLGYNLVLHFNNSEQDISELRTEILKKNRHCHLFHYDLKNPEGLKEAVQSGMALWGSLDLVIQNASSFPRMTFKETRLTDLQEQFNIHVFSPWMITQAVAEKQNQGHFIHMLDTRITKEDTRYMPYSLSKKSLGDFTRLAALSLAPGFRVNGIAPGLSLAPESLPPEEQDLYMEMRSRQIPLQKKGGVLPVIKALDYLLENDFVTGEIMFVDGGEHLHSLS